MLLVVELNSAASAAHLSISKLLENLSISNLLGGGYLMHVSELDST